MDNDYESPGYLETNITGNFNQKPILLFIIPACNRTIDDIVYKKHKEIIKTLYLESIEIITKRKDKIFDLQIYDGSKTLFKGEEINDSEESKKIGLRYLSPKHKFDPYKKININEEE